MSALTALVQALQQIDLKQTEENIINQVTPLLKNALENHETWFEERFLQVDEEQGFGSHLIAENEDHTLAVIITSWPHGRETPPHDHDTWAVIGCVKGLEHNIFWHRHDDKSDPDFAHISRGKVVPCNPGDIVAMRTHDIHSVMNPTPDNISVSLHVYGKHFNHTNRKKFDPDNKTVQPFIVRQQ
ncbi:MAG: cysteine dioxygenase family protein [Gammaproteobacteria bacterium]|nr:cysteine dioxygenase family protein [Gammaproteobacteria bacterium]